MANSSAKKLVKANRARLNALRLTILLSNLLYFAVRLRGLVLRRSTLDGFYFAVWFVLFFAYALPFYLLWTAARPRYFDDGSIMDGGEDISGPGVLEYAHDLIYVAVFVQVGLLVSKWALLGFMLVPVYAIYASCCSGGKSDDIVEEGGAINPYAEYASMSRKERRKADREARKQR